MISRGSQKRRCRVRVVAGAYRQARRNRGATAEATNDSATQVGH